MNEKHLRAWLEKWPIAPDCPLGEVAKIGSISWQKGCCHIEIVCGFYGKEAWPDRLTKALKSAFAGMEDVALATSIDTVAHAVKSPLKPLAGVKNMLAVASGKGGVGKSTASALLALSLAEMGAKVGLLDADIYGPNQATLLGSEGLEVKVVDGKMQPTMARGIPTQSMHYLLQTKEDPVVWRGPMASKALLQMATQTKWGALDYLLVDLPPGTGDVQLSLVQKLPLTAVVMVTTPQTLACLDTAKGMAMFTGLGIPVLGVIENMAAWQCSACGHVDHPWGEYGGRALSEHYQVPFLGEWPLRQHRMRDVDSDCVHHWLEDSASRACYSSSAWQVGLQCARLPKVVGLHIPPVVVQRKKQGESE